MTKITIIGGGQSGLQLGIGLLQNGYDVTVVSDRTPEQIHDGRVTSSQCMFATALDHERELGIDFWDDTCPPVEGISLAVPHPEIPGAKAIDWAARLDRIAMSVDQRLKFPRWMEHFASNGGELVIREAGIDDLERYAEASELVVVAAGKGDITRLFERDAERSQFEQPMRALALTYVTGMTPRPEFSAVCFNLVPGVGEYFVFPALTTSGPCEIMVFEGVPAGPMDCWGDVSTPAEHLGKSKWILETFMPWEAERCRSIELTDDNGILSGRLAPTIRKPVGRLPSGRAVLGMADAVILNDPITGQGSNNASKGAAVYLSRSSSAAARSTRRGCRRHSSACGCTPRRSWGGRTRSSCRLHRTSSRCSALRSASPAPLVCYWQVTIRYGRPSDVLGTALVVGGPLDVRAQTLAPSTILGIDVGRLEEAARSDAAVAYALSQELSRRLDETLQQMAISAFGSVKQRVASQLLELAPRRTAPTPGCRRSFPSRSWPTRWDQCARSFRGRCGISVQPGSSPPRRTRS